MSKAYPFYFDLCAFGTGFYLFNSDGFTNAKNAELYGLRFSISFPQMRNELLKQDNLLTCYGAISFLWNEGTYFQLKPRKGNFFKNKLVQEVGLEPTRSNEQRIFLLHLLLHKQTLWL